MRMLTYLLVWTMWCRDRVRVRDDRGDVPGWVMVTVMTAILVVAILGIFEPQVKGALSGVIDQVKGAGK